MKKHRKALVNNLICETLHPKNIIAKLYTTNIDNKHLLVQEMNDCVLKNDYKGYIRTVKKANLI
jgi:hypothetical protein